MEIEPNRHALGLPPRLSPRKRLVFSLMTVLIVPTILAGVGWLGGMLYRNYQVAVAQDAYGLIATADTATLALSIRQVRRDTASLKKHRDTRALLAVLYLFAAERLPQQRLYWDEALAEINAAIHLTKTTDREDMYGLLSMRAGLLHNLGHDKKALAETNRADTLLAELAKENPTSRYASDAWRLKTINDRAYFLASVSDSRLRKPAAALALAKAVMLSTVRDADEKLPSQTAAYVDTLAEAYFASGNPQQALAVQRRALVLADGAGVTIYLEHYDKYFAASKAHD